MLKILILCLYISVVFFPLLAQNKGKNSQLNEGSFEAFEDTLSTRGGLFEDETPINITLKYDISSFIRKKSKSEYYNAELVVHEDDSIIVSKNIKLKARGNFRKGHCFFPPMHLNFKSDRIVEEGFQEVKKMKLVTHCSGSRTNETYILKEYLVYKLYNLLSEYSFRVRLLDINYVDTGKKSRNYQRYGFVIEPESALIKRLNAISINPKIVKGPDILENDADRVALFHYMIGNTDWRFKSGHNMKYIKPLDTVTTKVVCVPYDFDFSGFVNASYAHPQEWTSIESIRDREYLGYCRDSDDNYLTQIELFINKKEEMYKIIDSFELLSNRQQQDLKQFINEFFQEAASSKVIIRSLRQTCRDDF